jgi:hypothetical protein
METLKPRPPPLAIRASARFEQRAVGMAFGYPRHAPLLTAGGGLLIFNLSRTKSFQRWLDTRDYFWTVCYGREIKIITASSEWSARAGTELWFGIDAEGKSLESIADPLSS